jgi:hypothetical protein
LTTEENNMARHLPPRRRVSKERLVAIAERLMSNEPLSTAEVNRLVDEFNANTYPDSADFILEWGNRFKNATELVDFALGQLEMKKLTREELIEVTRKLMTADIADEFEATWLCELFVANVPHPAETDLIFYPKVEFKTPEQLVDYALAYKASKE